MLFEITLQKEYQNKMCKITKSWWWVSHYVLLFLSQLWDILEVILPELAKKYNSLGIWKMEKKRKEKKLILFSIIYKQTKTPDPKTHS